MRRIYKIALVPAVAAVIISLLFAFSSSAANVRYSVAGASGNKGDTVTVSVKLSSDVAIWGANVSLGFNANELQYVSCAKGGLVSGGSLVRSGSQINFSGMYGGKSGTVFTVKFKILKDSGSSALTLSSTENTDSDGKTYSCSSSGGSVTVVKSVTGVSLNSSRFTLKKGETAQLSATVTPSDATNRAVRFTTSNSRVATVSASGKITAVGGGTAKITATAGGKSAVCTVSVNVKQTGITVSGSKDKTVGESASIKLTTAKVPADATDSYAVSWSSSDSSVAAVSNDGTVTGVKLGKAVITATSNGWTASYNITVTEKPSESDTETDSSSQETSSEETSSFENETYSSTTAAVEEVSEEPKTVKKTYYYTMLVLTSVTTALVCVPVTALVTSNIYKSQLKRKEENPFGKYGE